MSGIEKLNRAFSAIFDPWTIEFLGRCPRLALNSAFGASAQNCNRVEPTSCIFSAKGAVSLLAWGNAPGFMKLKPTSAEGAGSAAGVKRF
jgi:hypothetical protein